MSGQLDEKLEELTQPHRWRYLPAAIRAFLNHLITWTGFGLMLISVMFLVTQPALLVGLGIGAAAFILTGVGFGAYFARAEYAFYKEVCENRQLSDIAAKVAQYTHLDTEYQRLLQDADLKALYNLVKSDVAWDSAEHCQQYASTLFSKEDFAQFAQLARACDSYEATVTQWLQQQVAEKPLMNADDKKLDDFQSSRPVSAYHSTMSTIFDVCKVATTIILMGLGATVAPMALTVSQLILLGMAGTTALGGGKLEAKVRAMIRERDCLSENLHSRNEVATARNRRLESFASDCGRLHRQRFLEQRLIEAKVVPFPQFVAEKARDVQPQDGATMGDSAHTLWATAKNDQTKENTRRRLHSFCTGQRDRHLSAAAVRAH